MQMYPYISIGTLSVVQTYLAVNVSGYKEKDDSRQVSDDEGGAWGMNEWYAAWAVEVVWGRLGNSFYRSTVCYSPFPTHAVFLHTCLKPLNVMLKVTVSSDNDHKIQTYISQFNHSDFLESYINSEILDLEVESFAFVYIYTYNIFFLILFNSNRSPWNVFF